MRIKKYLAIACLIIFLSSTITFAINSQTETNKPLVVTTTSVLASIVRDLAGNLVNVKYIVSPSMCPGHYDIKPGDVETIRNASLILAHGMEWSSWLGELIDSANQTGDLDVPIYNVAGPWNTPTYLAQKYSEIAEILETELGLDLEDRLSVCLNAINNVETELISLGNEYGFNETPVAVMQWQSAFIEFLGFKIVATYGPPELLSTEDQLEVMNNITEFGAKLIIDNLQSGVSFGEKVAKETGIVQVVLINFPESVPGVSNVTEMMLYNAKLLTKGLEHYEFIVENNVLKSEVKLWQYVSTGLVIVIAIESLVVVALVKRREQPGS